MLDLTSLLDTERRRLAAQDSLAQANAAGARALVDLFRYSGQLQP